MIRINKNINSLKPSATLAINQKVKTLRSDGENICHFGFGQSPFPIHDSIVAELKIHASKNSYLPTLGLEALRRQISIFLKEHQNVEVNWEYIFIGPGSKELLYQTILILEGTFLIPKGSWVSYGPQIEAKGDKFLILETEIENNFKLTSRTLETYCKKVNDQKILILNSPNNPTGAVYSEEELKALAKVCKDYGVIVLSDEIYSQVNFDNDYSPSISKYYPELTFVFGGLSKVFSAGGYRLGFMCMPSKLKKYSQTFRSLFSETFSAVAAPIQYAGIEAFKMKIELKNYIKECANVLKRVSQYIYNELTSVGIDCSRPQGAFYMIIGFNNYKGQLNKLKIKTSSQLASYLLSNYKVALLPASDFYFQEEELYFRLAFVDFDGEEVINNLNNSLKNLKKGIEGLKKFVLEIS